MDASQIVHAILLQKKAYSNTSWLCDWYSHECGHFRALAKGGQRPKSGFAGQLDLFVTAQVRVLWGRNHGLAVMQECVVEKYRFELRHQYKQVLAASYFAFLVMDHTEMFSSLPELYDLLDRALDFLSEGDVSLRVVEHFEYRMAEVQGMMNESLPKSAGIGVLAQHHHRPIPKMRRELVDLMKAVNEL
jgi:DNA repair protein RecO